MKNVYKLKDMFNTYYIFNFRLKSSVVEIQNKKINYY